MPYVGIIVWHGERLADIGDVHIELNHVGSWSSRSDGTDNFRLPVAILITARAASDRAC